MAVSFISVEEWAGLGLPFCAAFSLNPPFKSGKTAEAYGVAAAGCRQDGTGEVGQIWRLMVRHGGGVGACSLPRATNCFEHSTPAPYRGLRSERQGQAVWYKIHGFSGDKWPSGGLSISTTLPFRWPENTLAHLQVA